MATTTTRSAAIAVQPALLYMPDISGFTQFVTSTEIDHAQGIIQELLEVLIDSNQLGLEVGEVEGDAVFFYRLGGAAPSNEHRQGIAVRPVQRKGGIGSAAMVLHRRVRSQSPPGAGSISAPAG